MVGILVGAIMAVVFAKLFMAAYPVLLLDQTVMKAGEQPAEWSAAMTYKFVGVLRSLTDDKPYQRTAIWVGVAIGFAIQLRAQARSSRNAAYQALRRERQARVRDGLRASTRCSLPSPYASSFGGFVNLHTSLWFGGGGIVSSAVNTLPKRKPAAGETALPEDMSTTSLVGGGLIAGDALAALGLGIVGLAGTVLLK